MDQSAQNFDPKLKVLEDSVHLNPLDEQAWFNLGQHHEQQSRLRVKAITCYRKVIEINPRCQPAYRQLGWCYNGLGKLADAEDYLRQAVELNPQDFIAYSFLGNCCWKQGDKRKAESAFAKALNLGPDCSIVNWMAGCFYSLSLEKDQYAEKLFGRAIELDPEDQAARYFFARYLWELDRVDEAREQLGRSLEIDPAFKLALNLMKLISQRD